MLKIALGGSLLRGSSRSGNYSNLLEHAKTFYKPTAQIQKVTPSISICETIPLNTRVLTFCQRKRLLFVDTWSLTLETQVALWKNDNHIYSLYKVKKLVLLHIGCAARFRFRSETREIENLFAWKQIKGIFACFALKRNSKNLKPNEWEMKRYRLNETKNVKQKWCKNIVGSKQKVWCEIKFFSDKVKKSVFGFETKMQSEMMRKNLYGSEKKVWYEIVWFFFFRSSFFLFRFKLKITLV